MRPPPPRIPLPIRGFEYHSIHAGRLGNAYVREAENFPHRSAKVLHLTAGTDPVEIPIGGGDERPAWLEKVVAAGQRGTQRGLGINRRIVSLTYEGTRKRRPFRQLVLRSSTARTPNYLILRCPNPVAYSQIVSAGDITADGTPDLFIVTTDGQLWMFSGHKGGYYKASTRLTSSARADRDVVSIQDITGDNVANLLYRTNARSIGTPTAVIDSGCWTYKQGLG